MILPPTSASWVMFPKRNPQARLRLFCFPYAGGGAPIFRTWPDGFPNSVEVCAVQLPGRGSHMKEAPFTRLTPLVEAAASALLPYLDKPFAFYGHSMGALVSLELARQLRAISDRSPSYLFVSGRGAPHVLVSEQPIHTLPDPDLLEKLRRLNGTPPEVLEHKEPMELLLPTLRADLAVCETYLYSPGSPLKCPIAAFGGLQDHRTRRDELESWREYTNKGFRLRMFSGDYFFLRTEQALLLQTICQELCKFESTFKTETLS